jgi:hypothetical protein
MPRSYPIRRWGSRPGFRDNATPILEGADFAHQLERARVAASQVLEQGGTATKNTTLVNRVTAGQGSEK